jgi:hypothetical protein
MNRIAARLLFPEVPLASGFDDALILKMPQRKVCLRSSLFTYQHGYYPYFSPNVTTATLTRASPARARSTGAAPQGRIP